MAETAPFNSLSDNIDNPICTPFLEHKWSQLQPGFHPVCKYDLVYPLQGTTPPNLKGVSTSFSGQIAQVYAFNECFLGGEYHFFPFT